LLLLTELLGHKVCLLTIESDVSEWDRHAVLAQKLTRLILMKLDASHGEILGSDEGAVGSETRHPRVRKHAKHY
jgi:hypothetical protein